jgi:hypothetical protein
MRVDDDLVQRIGKSEIFSEYEAAFTDTTGLPFFCLFSIRTPSQGSPSGMPCPNCTRGSGLGMLSGRFPCACRSTGLKPP